MKWLIYGSGGFISYNDEQLEHQLGGWANVGIKYVKMKIGTHPKDDVSRVKKAREAIDLVVRIIASGTNNDRLNLFLLNLIFRFLPRKFPLQFNFK